MAVLHRRSLEIIQVHPEGIIAAQKLHISRLTTALLMCCALAACTGNLVYRPEKKVVPVQAVDMTHREHLPTMPDPKANSATVAGIDTTGSGVRDDVHIWIFSTYTTATKRTILMTMARSMQSVIVTPPKTVQQAEKLSQSNRETLARLKLVQGVSDLEADQTAELLFGQQFNTDERLKLYLQYNLLLQGGKNTH